MRENEAQNIKRKVEEEVKKNQSIFLGRMNAITNGVEARFEETTGYWRNIVETTANIARALGMPEDQINEWASCQSVRGTDKGRIINPILNRLHEAPYDQ